MKTHYRLTPEMVENEYFYKQEDVNIKRLFAAPNKGFLILVQVCLTTFLVFACCSLFSQSINNPVFNSPVTTVTITGAALFGTQSTVLTFTATVTANNTIYVRVDDNANVAIATFVGAGATGASAGGTAVKSIGPDGANFLTVIPTAACRSVKITITGALASANSTKVYYAFYSTTFTADCGRPIATSTSTTGVAIGLQIATPVAAIDADIATYSSLQSTVGIGLASTLTQLVGFNGPCNLGDGVRLLIQNPSQLLNLSVNSSIQFQAYNGNSVVGTVATVTNVLGGTDVVGLFNNGTVVSYPFYPVDALGNSILFDKVLITVSAPFSAAAASEFLRVYDVQRIPMALPITPLNFPIAACDIPAGTINGVQSAQSSIANIGTLTYNWYATATSTTVLATSTSISPAVAVGGGATGRLNVPTTPGVYTFFVNVGKTCAGDTSIRRAVNITVTSCLTIHAKVLLQGALVGTTMTTFLNSGGLTPKVDPYTVFPFSHINTAAENGLAIVPAGVTDWVLVELRDAGNAIVGSRAAFLKADGTLMDMDGTTGINFSLPTANYNLAIRHRNHLGVRTATPRPFGAGANAVVDFTTGAKLGGVNDVYTNPNIGNAPQATVGNLFALWGGDVNSDGIITVTGTGNDGTAIVTALGGDIFGYTDTLYLSADVNLNMISDYTGTGNGFAWIISHALGGDIFGYLAQHL